MSIKSQFNQKGFATITLMLFLPMICMIMMAFAFSSYLIQFKTKMRSLCLTKSVEIQNKLILGEEELFKLNKLVANLRLKLITKKQLLAVAISTQNYAIAAELEVEILIIKTQQAQLDLLQKSIIEKTTLEVNTKMKDLEAELTLISQKMNNLWNWYLRGVTNVRPAKWVQVSVRPDNPDVAPIYELTHDYIEKQRVAYSWQHTYATINEHQKVISDQNQFEMSCGAEAKKEGSFWKILINVDKYSLNQFLSF